MRAALNKQWGHMRPAGRQFDMPALGVKKPKQITAQVSPVICIRYGQVN